MQTAMQHPENYFRGETWVLGDQAAPSLDAAGVSKRLAAKYSADFLKEWHAFLTDARFTGCGPLRDLPGKLGALAGPDSPLLELFGTASYNTAVPDPQIKNIFQPTQALGRSQFDRALHRAGQHCLCECIVVALGCGGSVQPEPANVRRHAGLRGFYRRHRRAADRAALQHRSPDAYREDCSCLVGRAYSLRCSTTAAASSRCARCAVLTAGQIPFPTLVQDSGQPGSFGQRAGFCRRCECRVCSGTGSLWTYYNAASTMVDPARDAVRSCSQRSRTCRPRVCAIFQPRG